MELFVVQAGYEACECVISSSLFPIAADQRLDIGTELRSKDLYSLDLSAERSISAEMAPEMHEERFDLPSLLDLVAVVIRDPCLLGQHATHQAYVGGLEAGARVRTAV